MGTKSVKSSVLGASALAVMALSLVLTPAKASAGLFDWWQDGGDDNSNQHQAPQPSPWFFPGQDDDDGRAQGPRPTHPQPPRHHPTQGDPQLAPPTNEPATPESRSTEAARDAFMTQPRNELPMYVVKTAWTDADELQWQKFIAQLGAARASGKCTTVKGCLQNPVANMYANQDPPGMILFSDCAEFPYLLRTYFAYHNGLPFGHVTNVRKNEQALASQADQDAILPTTRLDNDPYGNVIISRGGTNLGSTAGNEPNYLTYLMRTYDGISTRSFRVGPLSPNYDLSDVYPVTIDRNGIAPGTIVHTTGHAMVVWSVDDKGVIHVIDGHPDNSMQFKTVNASTLERSRPDQGLGLYKFRPLRVENAKLNANGAYYGGKIVTENDADLVREGKLSLDQWFGPNSNVFPGSQVDPDQWRKAFKTVGGFFAYLADQLRDKNIVIQADDEVGDRLNDLCDQLQNRLADVDAAVKAGITAMAHPSSIPQDVFGEDDSAVWGPYSTNGRDARVKAEVQVIIKDAVAQYRTAKSAPGGQIQFSGEATDYVKSLSARLATLDKSCTIKYTNSQGHPISLSFLSTLGRLNKMSFDPYLCPEKRWGASAQELATCRDHDSNSEWYKAEAKMYNTVDKNNSNGVPVIRSNRAITLDMLQDASNFDTPDANPVDLGTATAPIMDLNRAFNSPTFMNELLK